LLYFTFNFGVVLLTKIYSDIFMRFRAPWREYFVILINGFQLTITTFLPRCLLGGVTSKAGRPQPPWSHEG
jgi:hypothetical protein